MAKKRKISSIELAEILESQLPKASIDKVFIDEAKETLPEWIETSADEWPKPIGDAFWIDESNKSPRIYAKDFNNGLTAVAGLVVGLFYRLHDAKYKDELIFEAIAERMVLDFQPSAFVSVSQVEPPKVAEVVVVESQETI